MSALIWRLVSLGCVTVDVVIWAIYPHSIDAVAAWLCAAVLVGVMVGLILDRRRA